MSMLSGQRRSSGSILCRTFFDIRRLNRKIWIKIMQAQKILESLSQKEERACVLRISSTTQPLHGEAPGYWLEITLTGSLYHMNSIA